MKALSIRPVWAWLIINGHKDIENRVWKTLRRERIYIHASQTMKRDDYESALRTTQIASAMLGKEIVLPAFEDLPRGGIIGSVEIVDCVTRHSSPWFFGDYGFVLKNPTPLPFQPCKGALQFFDAKTAA